MDHLTFRQVNEADLPLIRQWAARPENAEMFRRLPPVWTWPNSAYEWFATSFIVMDESGKSLGLLPVTGLDAHNKQAEVGLLLDREACAPRPRRQVAIAALKLMATYLFDYMGLEKVSFKALAHRESFFKGFEEHGLKREAYLRRNVRWNNEFHDEVVYSLLASEWEALKGK